MAKFSVYGLVSATVSFGEYEADTEAQAIALAEDDDNSNFNPTLCHQCSDEVDLGDVYEVKADKI